MKVTIRNLINYARHHAARLFCAMFTRLEDPARIHAEFAYPIATTTQVNTVVRPSTLASDPVFDADIEYAALESDGYSGDRDGGDADADDASTQASDPGFEAGLGNAALERDGHGDGAEDDDEDTLVGFYDEQSTDEGYEGGDEM